MPWHVQPDHPSCPVNKPFGVVQGHTGEDGGALEGCHPTRESANKQLAALYATEDSMNKGRSAPSDVHAGSGDVANEADISFLHNIEVSLTGTSEAATSHIGNGQHAEVMALAQDVAATHGAQMAKASALKARLSDGHAPNAAAPGAKGPAGDRARSSQATFETRSVPFELGDARDGLTFSGYAAVYNSPTRISSRFEGEFDEVILPGAFKRSLSAKTPVLMFDHGQHPLIGSMPLGVITRAEEDSNGLYIEARLTDNWLIQPVRDAVRDGAVDGMSFRFSVSKDGEKWQARSGDVQLRTIHSFDAVPELGPVVFPAYEPTTASVRSQLAHIEATFAERLAASAARNAMPKDLTGRTARGAVGGDSSSDGPSSGGRTDLSARDLARAPAMRALALRSVNPS